PDHYPQKRGEQPPSKSSCYGSLIVSRLNPLSVLIR
ncbi:MAG: hypothetical protein ACI9FJ_000137, partial [Alteromonadaceae bacterium]